MLDVPTLEKTIVYVQGGINIILAIILLLGRGLSKFDAGLGYEKGVRARLSKTPAVTGWPQRRVENRGDESFNNAALLGEKEGSVVSEARIRAVCNARKGNKKIRASSRGDMNTATIGCSIRNRVPVSVEWDMETKHSYGKPSHVRS